MKRWITMLLAWSMALSLAACTKLQEKGKETISEADAAQETTTEAEEPAAYYPVTVTDQAGREVVIEEEPQKLDQPDDCAGVGRQVGWNRSKSGQAPHLFAGCTRIAGAAECGFCKGV